MLCLPRKVTLMIDPRHIWNVSYTAQSNKSHPPTSPNTAPATQNDSHEWCPSHMKRHLQCADNKSDPPTSPNSAPATQNDSHDWCPSRVKHHLQCAEQQVSSSNVTKYCTCHATLHSKIEEKLSENRWSVIYNARPTHHDPSMKSSSRTRPFAEDTFRASEPHFVLKITTFRAPAIYPNFTKYCACHKKWHSKITKYCACHAKWLSWLMSIAYENLQCAEQQVSSSNVTKYCTCHAKWLSWLMSVTCETSFAMRGATSLILRRHQILHLPRKMTLMIDVRHVWNVICNARSNKSDPPSSPKTAPATQNDSHEGCPSHMKRYLQCAEQQASPSNLTKYCACHATLHSKIEEKLSENRWSVIYNARPIREWSDHDPSMKSSSRTRPFAEVTFRASEPHFVLKITTFRAPATYPNFTKYCACHEKWHSKITKYCACHEKWFASLMSIAYEMSFTMRGATGVIHQRHQVLRLPRKMTRIIDPRDIWNVIYNARSNRCHPTTSPRTAPAT